MITVRPMREGDIPQIVEIDCVAFGRPRPHYFEVLLLRSLNVTDLQVSFVAEVDGRVAGYLMASLNYGEYGIAEPSVSVDAIGVAPPVRGNRVGHAMLDEMRKRVAEGGITRLRTEVDWDDFELLAFFEREGFAPAKRLCLESGNG